jgi:hypothetical protein
VSLLGWVDGAQPIEIMLAGISFMTDSKKLRLCALCQQGRLPQRSLVFGCSTVPLFWQHLVVVLICVVLVQT